MDEHQTVPVTSSSSLGRPWGTRASALSYFSFPCLLLLLFSFCFFPPFLLFVCYFQSFLSALFLFYLFPLLRCSVPLLCSLQERRRGYCCNLVLISYLAWGKQPKCKETTAILFEKCHRSFKALIQSLQKN